MKTLPCAVGYFLLENFVFLILILGRCSAMFRRRSTSIRGSAHIDIESAAMVNYADISGANERFSSLPIRSIT